MHFSIESMMTRLKGHWRSLLSIKYNFLSTLFSFEIQSSQSFMWMINYEVIFSDKRYDFKGH